MSEQPTGSNLTPDLTPGSAVDMIFPRPDHYPYRCPVCLGKGIVDQGFYSTTGMHWGSSSTAETCRSCQGTGVVWR